MMFDADERTVTIAAAILYASRIAQKWPETASHRDSCLQSAVQDATDMLRLIQQAYVPPPGTLSPGVKPHTAGARRRG